VFGHNSVEILSVICTDRSMGHQQSAIEKDFKGLYLNLDRLRKPRSKWLSRSCMTHKCEG
jgi:hypothetical protein